MNQTRKRNSAKVNLTISLVFHGVMICALTFLAAREGMLGKKLKELTVTLAPKEKKPEPPKEKPLEPKVEAPKVAEAPKQAVPTTTPTPAAPPPVASLAAPPSAAPPSASLPAMEFYDGAKQVITTTDATVIYKSLVENSLRARWVRPDDISDDDFVAEIELSLDGAGKVAGYDWKRRSGNARWDDSVKQAVAATRTISRPPPKGFPAKFMVRFDVEAARTEPLLSASGQ